MRFSPPLFAALLSLDACAPPHQHPVVNQPESTPKEVELQPSASTPPPEPSAGTPSNPPEPPEPSIQPVITFTGAFATPESVLYDAAADRYLVSNINGQP